MDKRSRTRLFLQPQQGINAFGRRIRRIPYLVIMSNIHRDAGPLACPHIQIQKPKLQCSPVRAESGDLYSAGAAPVGNGHGCSGTASGREGGTGGGFFHNAPVVIDLKEVAAVDAHVEFPLLVGLMRGHGMIPVGVRGGTRPRTRPPRPWNWRSWPTGRGAPRDKPRTYARVRSGKTGGGGGNQG